MRLLMATILVVLSHFFSNAQDSFTLELKADPASLLTNNVTSGMEMRVENLGIQVDYGFLAKLIRYDRTTIFSEIPDDEWYDSGNLYKVSFKLYDLLKKERQYIIIQFARARFESEFDEVRARGLFVGLGERIDLKPFVLDYYISMGFGSSSNDSRNHNFAFYKFDDFPVMFSCGVLLAIPVIKI